MNTKKIGNFLRDLRREQNLTQEELGEKLGATNKTISRWETGTYMPPADILLQLSKLYGVSVNEILSGERLTTADYQPKAEENIVTTLNTSNRAIKDRKIILLICLAVVLILAIANAVVIASYAFKNEYYTVTFVTDGEVLYLSFPNVMHIKRVNRDNDVYTYRFYISNASQYPYYENGVSKYGYRLVQPSIHKFNHSLVGWYTSLDESGKKWNFKNDTINSNITLYAKWEDATEGLAYSHYSYEDGSEDNTKTGYVLVGAQLRYGESDIIIPSYYNGEPVLAVTSRAFEWSMFLESVIIPDTVIEISDSAFHGCVNLKSVRLGSNLKYIGDNAFDTCRSLKNIDLPDGLKEIGPNSFTGCKMMQT